jgi:predicted permease
VCASFDPRLAGLDAARLPALYERLLAEARRLPGAESAALALTGVASGSARTSGVVVEGRPQLVDDEAREDYVTTGYFSAVGMRMVRGRDIEEGDTVRTRPVAVVNQAFVRRFFDGEDPIGRHFGYDAPPTVEIVGVVADARVDGLRDPAPAMVYYPLAQHPGEYVRNMYVRVSGSPADAVNGLRRALAVAAPALALRDAMTLVTANERTVANVRLVSQLTALFGLLAVAVACLGLYGTLAYSVSRRTNELGVRMALGATAGDVRVLVLKQTLVLVGAGALAGLFLVIPLARFVSSLLYGLTAHDPLTLAASVVTVGAVGLLVGALPAWRASRVNPADALRAE